MKSGFATSLFLRIHCIYDPKHLDSDFLDLSTSGPTLAMFLTPRILLELLICLFPSCPELRSTVSVAPSAPHFHAHPLLCDNAAAATYPQQSPTSKAGTCALPGAS